MSTPAWKQVTARAWELRPDWRENLVLLAVGALLMWLTGIAWWSLCLIYAFTVPSFFLLLGWLELHNEAAGLEESDEAQGGD